MVRISFRKVYALPVALLIVLLGSGAVWSYVTRSQPAGVNTKAKQPKQVAATTPTEWVDSSYSNAKVQFGEEISLDEFMKDKIVRAPRVPKYLPAKAKFDVALRDPTGIGLHYKIGDDWIDIVETPQPIQPDYQTQTNKLLKMAERVRPDGSTETVPLKTNGVSYETLPDGTREPIAVDSVSVVEIDGIWAYYSENLDKGDDSPVIEAGRKPRETTTRGRNFGFWSSGKTEQNIA